MTASGHGTEIEIRNVDFDDAGTYRGTAQNGVGQEAYCTIVLIVESAPYWRQNKVPGDVEADDEDDVELECLADGRPRPNITWSLNGHHVDELPNDPRRSLDGNRLRIANVNKSDAAIIQCTAANEHGSILANVILTVSASPPSFATSPEDTKVVEGGNAVLSCNVFGSPKPQISWLRGRHDPEPINDDRFTQHPNGNLEVKGALLDDADSYHCVATNKFGSEKASCSLIVRTPTIIRRPDETEIIANVTDDVRIPCDVQTDPAEQDRLRVEWRRDGRPIDVDDAHLSVDATDFSLHISSAEVIDTAGYTCHASNGLDEATSEVTKVTVRGRPDPPTNLRVTTCTTDYAEINWSPSVDNNSPVIEYIVFATDSSSLQPDQRAEIARVPSRRGRSGAADESAQSAVVQTNPWATYVYSVVATNALGVSDPANGTDDDGDGRDDSPAVCVTTEAAPKRNPRHVCSRLERPRQLKIVWEPILRPEQNGAGFHYLVSYRLMDGQRHQPLTNEVRPASSSELVIYNQELFKQYEIFVQSVNNWGVAPLQPGEKKIGYSGEGKPLDSPQNLRLNAAKLNSTYAEFSRKSVV
jgi:hypothetical protein